MSAYTDLLGIGRKLLDAHGLKGWRFDVENCQNPFRWPESRYGIRGGCRHLDKLIVVDNHFLEHPRAAKQVILHEIAHALIGPDYRVHGGHGPKFFKLARKLGCHTSSVVEQYEFSWRYRTVLRWDDKGDWSVPR